MRKDKGVTAPRASLCSPPSSLSLSPAVPSGSCIPPETRPPRFSTMLSGSSGFPYSWDTALSPAESGKTTCSPTQGDWLPPAFLLSIPLGPLLHHPVHDPAVSIPAILPLSFPPWVTCHVPCGNLCSHGTLTSVSRASFSSQAQTSFGDLTDHVSATLTLPATPR